MRLLWSMSPCSAPALKPCFCSDLCRIATSRLRLQKMMAFLTFSLRISSRSTSRFSSLRALGQKRKRWVMVRAGRGGLATSMRTGSLRNC